MPRGRPRKPPQEETLLDNEYTDSRKENERGILQISNITNFRR
jgi:hypothetical protein